MRLLFAKPTYGPTPDPLFEKSARAAIMYAATHGVTWVGDASPDRMGWAAARNAVVEIALSEKDVDGVFWMDDDILMPIPTIAQLASYGLDFVSALYFQRAEPYWPLFARLTPKMSFEWGLQYPENVVAPCDGVGFGCVLTSTKMLRAIAALPECLEGGPFGGDFGKRTYGEDFLFCLRARKAGFQPHVDTALKCSHYIGPMFSSEQLFRQFHGQNGGPHGTADSEQDHGGGLHQEDRSGGDEVRS